MYALNCTIQNGNLRNNIAQAVFPHHILQNLVRCFPLHFGILAATMGNGNITIIVRDTICDAFPCKFGFAMIPHTGLKIANRYKTVLFSCICRNIRILHIAHSSILFKLRCAIRVINRWLGVWIPGRIYPFDFVVVWISVCPRFSVICVVALQLRTSIGTDFCLINITITHCSCFCASRIP